MGKTLKKFKAGLSKKRQDRISARTAKLIIEETKRKEMQSKAK